MNKFFIGVLLTIITSCYLIRINSSKSSSYNKKVNNKDSLAFELCQIFGFDQGIRNLSKNPEYTVKLFNEIDSTNFVKIITFIKINGFPNVKILNLKNWEIECVQMSAISVLLHNSTRVIQPEVYELLKNEVKIGNLKSETLAIILDKYYCLYKGASLYGTTFKAPCISDKEKVNNARLDIGLNVLNDSLFVQCK